MIQRTRGTRDILDTTLYNYAVNLIKKYLHLYNYHEIITPILEPTELFKRSLGLETDVVSKEMFIVQSSSVDGEAESICLRPEATASIMRAYIENGIQKTPWKVFLTGPMFRYERPQKGRYRQFTQCSIEMIGSDSIMHDAECIMMLDRLFHEQFGLDEYALHINFLGTPSERTEHQKALRIFLNEQAELCQTCLIRKDKNILRVFDCKEATCQKIYESAPSLESFFTEQTTTEWQQLKNYLEELAVTFVVNKQLVRGLDYYNKTVFEFVSTRLGAQSTFCAGGRYDSLATALGANEDRPSCGAGIGIERLLILLEEQESSLQLEQVVPLYALIPFSEKQQALALHIADALRRAQVCVEIIVGTSIKSMMKKANSLGARGVLLLGDDEQAQGTITYKNMVKGTQETLTQQALVETLKKNPHL